ncbi:hypothetical protein [Desulfovibrio litoralis]|uniref:Uncharacterized protein n=1 Tax=Desulfovibrio litoralis DSM 11393 TaxID=1121455 RepID=A0A1M7T3Q7_9BACT|nr:hypothetical protein [Desulfovibrio litoralis]SHN65284.1 hypothetical protein SAMN02745728_01509 [Desulfovibrio litoralis DSM 11393]
MIKKYQHIIYGLLFAFIGLLVGIQLTITAIGDGYYRFIFFAPIAGFLSGTLFWYLIIMRKNSNNYALAIIVGVLTGTVSHWLCWSIFLVVGYIEALLSGSESHDSLISPLFAPLAAFSYSLFSLLFYGLYTVIGGIILALLLMHKILKLNTTTQWDINIYRS